MKAAKRKTVEFLPSSEFVANNVPMPKPASEYVPKWYRDVSMFHGGEGPQFWNNTLTNLSIKACGPFADSFKMGWIQETWADLWIARSPVEPDQMDVHSRRTLMVDVRERVNVPLPDHFYQKELVFRAPWIAKLPPGYSMLVTHPVNHFELPFYVPTGIVDADKFFHTQFGNLPFFVHKSFAGMIPLGTPMFQMIPVKRDEWDSEQAPWDASETEARASVMSSEFWGTYRQKFRQRKDYQ
jgi:hypothetical protein